MSDDERIKQLPPGTQVERPNPFYPGLVRAYEERERRRRSARFIDMAVFGAVFLFALKDLLSCS